MLDKLTPEQIEIAKKNGVNYKTLYSRIKELKWDVEKAITKKPKYNDTNLNPELVALAKENGINLSAYQNRVIRQKMDEREAAVKPLSTDQSKYLEKARDARRKHPQYYVDLAEKNGISKWTFYDRMRREWDIEEAATTPLKIKKGHRQKRKLIPNEYAVYRGDDYICSGTASECAEHLGVQVNTIYRYLSDTYKKEIESRKSTKHSLFVVCLDDDEDEEEENEAI